MKVRGKNKKKQWRRSFKGLDADLDACKLRAQISASDGFDIIKSNERQKRPVVKGDKESAKAYQDLPSASTSVRRVRRMQLRGRKVKAVDLWRDSAGTSSSLKASHAKPDLPLGGQSYNPSIDDHLTLLGTLNAIELQKRKMERKTENFMSAIRSAKKSENPLKTAQKFFADLQSDRYAPQPENVPDEEPVCKKRRTKTINTAKRMKNDLENIPRILKEIKQENRALALKRSHLKQRKLMKSKLKNLDTNIAFQLPNELTASLRKLQPASSLMWEMEKRRNKAMRSRKGVKRLKTSSSFERKR